MNIQSDTHAAILIGRTWLCLTCHRKCRHHRSVAEAVMCAISQHDNGVIVYDETLRPVREERTL